MNVDYEQDFDLVVNLIRLYNGLCYSLLGLLR